MHLMKYAKPCFAVALVLVSIASTVVAWRQYRELVALRAAALDGGARADWSARVRELEHRNGELQSQLLAARTASPEPASAPAPAERPDERARGIARGERGGRGPAALREMLDNPHVQALRAVQQRAALDQRYAGLFQKLDLPPEKLEQFKTLLADRQATAMDVLAAARDQGIDPRRNPEEFQKLLAAAQADLEGQMQSLIGDAGFAHYQSYEQTAAQRSVVSQLERRLSYSDAPLTPAQAEQLVQILAASSPSAPSAASARGVTGARADGPGRGASAPISAAALTQAQSVLNPTQLAALQELQQQQQAQQQLQQLVGESLGSEARGIRGGRRAGG